MNRWGSLRGFCLFPELFIIAARSLTKQQQQHSCHPSNNNVFLFVGNPCSEFLLIPKGVALYLSRPFADAVFASCFDKLLLNWNPVENEELLARVFINMRGRNEGLQGWKKGTVFGWGRRCNPVAGHRKGGATDTPKQHLGWEKLKTKTELPPLSFKAPPPPYQSPSLASSYKSFGNF